jgi:integrase
MGYVITKVGKNGQQRHTGMYRDITGTPRSAGTHDSADVALRKANAAEDDAKAGRGGNPKRSRVTLRAYIENDWLVHHVIEDTTREGYVYLLKRYIYPEIGDLRLRDVQPERVRAWITRLSTVHDANPPTVRNVKVVFDAVMTTAVNDQIIPIHPGRGIRTPPVARKPRRIITAEHYQRLHTSLTGEPTMQLLVETDIETGLRWGELTELRPRDIDWDSAILTVSRVVIHLRAVSTDGGPQFKVKHYPKDKDWREVKLAAHLIRKLRDHCTRHNLDPDDLLFPLPEVTGPARRRRPAVLPDPLTLGFTEPNDNGRTYRHGTLTAYQAGRCRCQHCKDAVAAYRAERRAAGKDDPRSPRTTATDDDRHMSNDWFRHNIWNPALKKAALGFRVTAHRLRHAHASWLLAGGADLQVVKERLGHGSITTTEKYLHTLPTHHDAALNALDNFRTATSSPEPPAPATPTDSPATPAATTDGDISEQLATVTVLPVLTPDPADVLQGMDPELVRQVLAGLLQQMQPPTPARTEGTA